MLRLLLKWWIYVESIENPDTIDLNSLNESDKKCYTKYLKKKSINETHSDGMSTGLFSDEEDGYNLEEETKYKLKLDAPKSEPAFGGSSGDELGGNDLDDFEDLGDEGDFGSEGDDKPFNDEPFDAGVEASEDEEPEKYIQQLSGKLGTSLRKIYRRFRSTRF